MSQLTRIDPASNELLQVYLLEKSIYEIGYELSIDRIGLIFPSIAFSETSRNPRHYSDGGDLIQPRQIGWRTRSNSRSNEKAPACLTARAISGGEIGSIG